MTLEELSRLYMESVPDSFTDDGINWPGALVPQEKLESMKNLACKPNDIIIESFPKSGTTWVSEMVSALLYDGDLEKIESSDLHHRVPALEFVVPGESKRQLECVKGMPQAYLSHLPLKYLSTQIRDEVKIIYVSRNPKDNAVSLYHFHRMCAVLGKLTIPFGDFLKLFVAGKVVFGPWFDHVLAFWEASSRAKKNVLFVKYEDMQKNISKEFDRISEFLGKNVSEDCKAKIIVEHCRFDSMASNKMTNREGLPIFDQSISKFMRRGVVGDWKNHFTDEESREFDKIYKEKMAGTGLDYDFE